MIQAQRCKQRCSRTLLGTLITPAPLSCGWWLCGWWLCEAGSKLAALQVELGEAQRAEDDPYLTYLLQLCQRTRQLLDQAPALTPEQQQQEAERQQEQAATGAGTGAGGEAAGEAGAKGVSGGRASRRRKASGTADPSGAADPYPDEPVLQLGGHVEL